MRSHDKELAIRPPIEEWAAAHFKYRRPIFPEESAPNDTSDDLSGEAFAEPDLPEFEP